MKKLFNVNLVLILTILIASCKHAPIETEEISTPVVTPKPPTVCDTAKITYTKTIKKIMSQSCNVCHETTSKLGGHISDTYAGMKKMIESGRFLGAIGFEKNYKAMPLNAPQLDSCDIEKIKAWIKSGMPQE